MEGIFRFDALLFTNTLFSNVAVRIIFTSVISVVGLLFIIVIIKVILENRSQQMVSNITKEQAVAKLVEYIKPYDLVHLLTRFLANLHHQQVAGILDADGELFFYESILNFIEQHIEQFSGTSTQSKYRYEYILDLLDKVYPVHPLSSSYILDRVGGEAHQRFYNQRLYNRHKVSDEYIQFSRDCLLHNDQLVVSQFGFTSTTYLDVLAELFLFEIQRQQMEINNDAAWRISRDKLLARFKDPIAVDRVISFLCSGASLCKLYDIKGYLFASDYTTFEDNAFSLIVNRLDDRKTSFGIKAGSHFESTVASVLKRLFRIHQHVYIKGNETDIVCEFGDIVIIIETKSRVYTFDQMEDRSKRANAKDKLKKASEQLLQRYQDVVIGNPIHGNDHSILISTDNIRLCIPLIVTLEDHYEDSNLVSPMHIEGHGAFLPITLSLDDLGGIIANCSNPYEFTSFLLYRQKSQISIKYIEMDKFVDFIQLNKLITDYNRLDPYHQNKVRDHYAVRRVAKRFGIPIEDSYRELLCLEMISILNDVAQRLFPYNSMITFVYPKLVTAKSFKDITSTKFSITIRSVTNGSTTWSIWISEGFQPTEAPYLWIRIMDGHFVEAIESPPHILNR